MNNIEQVEEKDKSPKGTKSEMRSSLGYFFTTNYCNLLHFEVKYLKTNEINLIINKRKEK